MPVFLSIAIYAIWGFIANRRSLLTGFCVTIALLVSLPAALRIEMGGALPELTIHRILLGIAFLHWWFSPAKQMPRPPLFGLMLAILCARFISVALSITPVPSIKDFLAFLIEVFFFYRVAYAVAAAEAQHRIRILAAVVTGLSVIAFFVVLERYTPLKPIQWLFPGLPQDSYGGIQATYQHRILFGYAMAMGVPLALVLLDWVQSNRAKRLLWIGIAAMAAACYFSTSRGPWLGLGLAMAAVALLGGRTQRRRGILIAAAAAAVMVVRPGVWETLANKYYETFDSSTLKGKSYEYRFRLWYVAASEIKRSPQRTLFGYGGLSTESMDLGHYFEAQAGGSTEKLGYTSWDSRYACDLIEFGVVGAGMLYLLSAAILLKLMRLWKKAAARERTLIAGILASASVFLFAQTNVDIFSMQLKFLFWLVVAVGFSFTFVSLEESNPPGGPPSPQDGRRGISPERATPVLQPAAFP